jgi:hypothetical protein
MALSTRDLTPEQKRNLLIRRMMALPENQFPDVLFAYCNAYAEGLKEGAAILVGLHAAKVARGELPDPNKPREGAAPWPGFKG